MTEMVKWQHKTLLLSNFKAFIKNFNGYFPFCFLFKMIYERNFNRIIIIIIFPRDRKIEVPRVQKKKSEIHKIEMIHQYTLGVYIKIDEIYNYLPLEFLSHIFMCIYAVYINRLFSIP